MRLLLWLLLGFLVYLAIRKNIQSTTSKKPGPTWSSDEQESAQAAHPSASDKPSETMVACAQCQVFIPSSEAVRRGTLVFCCDEHAQQFTAQ